MQADLVLQLLAAVLAQQLLQHVEAHPLLDAALGQGIEVHIVAQVAHLVGHDPQGRSLHVDGDLRHAHGVQQAGVVLGQQVAVLKQDLAGGGVGHRIHQLVAGHPVPQGQLLVELVPAHGGQVVAPGIEEQVVDQGLAGLHRGGLAGTQAPVDLQHGVLVVLAGVLLQRGDDAGIVAERVQNLLVRLQAQGPDQAGDGELPVLVDADPEDLVGVGLILQPGAPVGDHRGGEDGQVGLEVRLLAVVHAGGPDDLGDHHALGAVDDEGAGVGHQREVAHEDLLLLDLLGLLVPQADLHLQGRGVSGVPGLALLHVVLGRLVHLVVDEGQLQVALVVGDRAHVVEHLPQAGVQKLLVRLLLDLQKVGHGHDFLVPGEVLTKGLSVVLVFGHLLIHLSSVRPALSCRARGFSGGAGGKISIRTVPLLKFPYPALALLWEICYRYLNDKKWRNILCHHISVLFYHGFFPLSRGIWMRLEISSGRFFAAGGGERRRKGPHPAGWGPFCALDHSYSSSSA